MAETNGSDTVTVYIDDEPVVVPKGITMIEAAEHVGKEIPHYCYHQKLSVVGNCRMCLVELGWPMKDRATGEPILEEDGSPKIGWGGKPGIACNQPVAEGIRMRTDSDLVRDCRHGVMEFLLVNHPLDCPICDQAGECKLQEYATEYGRGYSRFIEEKNPKPKRTVLGPRVILDDERCILCSRCVRFMQEIPGDDVLGFIDHGSYSTLTCYPGRELDSNYSLNTVDICPVGALTSRDFRFQMRVWFLKPVDSICTESSVGANTQVWAREGKIYRITPRQNDAVNDTWMTDSGRDLYKQVEAEDRLTTPFVRGIEATPVQALRETERLLRPSERVAVVASTHSSVEEQYFLRRIADRTGAQRYAVRHWGEEDGLLLSADRTPNTRGALLTGLLDELPKPDLRELGAAIDRGEIDTVLCIHEDPLACGLTVEQVRKVAWVRMATHGSPADEHAFIVLPSLTVFERSGTFINQQFRLQKFRAVVPGPAGLLTDLQQLASLNSLLEDGPVASVQPDHAWKELSAEPGPFAGLRFRTLPSEGVALDPGEHARHPFPERQSLKYEADSFLASLPAATTAS